MAWLQSCENADVLLMSQAEGPLVKRTAALGIPFVELPLLPSSLGAFCRSWIALSRSLRNLRSKSAPHVVWTFEGREHTLCALHRIFCSSLWRGVRLVRVRGQAAPAKSHIFNRWIYTRASDAVVFVADVVRRRTSMAVSAERSKVFLYCADFFAGARPWENGGSYARENVLEYTWGNEFPKIDFSQPLYTVIGRYDPIKGHRELLRAFSEMYVERGFCQLVFIGKTQNVQAAAISSFAAEVFRGEVRSDGTRFCVQSADGKKRLFVCDEQFSDIALFVSKAHWGVIPSLGSEVICRVAVEFLQNGTPCLAHDVGALAEVLRESPSRIVPLGDHASLVKNLEEAYVQCSNRESFLETRNHCRRFGRERYSWERFPELLKWILSRPARE
jgi:glycosyltransferase involved in cell wall biosynthesis